ncbi:MAG: hypothetical protein AMJ53_06640 [Gammaproteobacteria bacterium SG8_11]|nr:MAG: hypothetical protein AMJ53_06640 [Gammaproteobacteria bacterium SG8_11]
MSQTLNNLKLVLFDLDWTLYDADQFYLQAWEMVATSVHQQYLPAITISELKTSLTNIWSELGPTEPYLFNKWMSNYGIYNKEVVQLAFDTLHGNWIPHLQPYEGVTEVLLKIAQKVKIAVLTEGRAGTQMRKIKALGLHSLFDEIFITDKIGAAKITSEPMKYVARHYDYRSSEILVVGDSYEKDITVPKLLGSHTALILHSAEDANAADYPDADLVLQSTASLINIL